MTEEKKMLVIVFKSVFFVILLLMAIVAVLGSKGFFKTDVRKCAEGDAHACEVVRAAMANVVLLDLKNAEPAAVKNGNNGFRDGQTYKTVVIGGKTWMAENLNVETDESYCYEDKPANCKKYGRLYTWNAAMKACPSGWHLPSMAEFKTLINAAGGEHIAGRMLKSTSGWIDNGNGADVYNFSALPAGYNGGGYYTAEGDMALFWSSSQKDDDNAVGMHFNHDYNSALQHDYGTDFGLSVRCVKD